MGNLFQTESEDEHTHTPYDENITHTPYDENITQVNSTLHVDQLLRYTEEVVRYDQHAPSPTFVDLGDRVPGAYLVENLLTPEECRQYIDISEKMGYDPSPLRNLETLNSTNFTRDKSTTSIRNSVRVLFDVPDHIGHTLEQRILPLMPEIVECEGSQWQVHKENPINQRWRFNRYDKGQYFRPHYDAGFVYGKDDKTLFSFILYLNEGFEGGETIFFPGGRKNVFDKVVPGLEFKVVPRVGTALCFFQAGKLSHLHEGAELLGETTKYILRSDLRYTRIT